MTLEPMIQTTDGLIREMGIGRGRHAALVYPSGPGLLGIFRTRGLERTCPVSVGQDCVALGLVRICEDDRLMLTPAGRAKAKVMR